MEGFNNFVGMEGLGIMWNFGGVLHFVRWIDAGANRSLQSEVNSILIQFPLIKKPCLLHSHRFDGHLRSLVVNTCKLSLPNS